MPVRGSKTSTVPFVWATLEFFRRDLDGFISRLVTMNETWLYHYDPETKQQSMEWRRSGSSRHKNSECKNPLENFSPRFFGVKKASSSLIIFQRAKLSTRIISHLCWCDCRTFWRKTAAGSLPRWSCSFTTTPRLTGHLQPRRKWPTIQCLDQSPYSPDLASSVYYLFPGLNKTIESSPFFFRPVGHYCRGDLVVRTKFWIFLSGLQSQSNWLRSLLSFVWCMLSKSRVWSL
jgi:hypothetical protein